MIGNLVFDTELAEPAISPTQIKNGVDLTGPSGRPEQPSRDQTHIGIGPDCPPADPSCVAPADLRL
jgi:hypothetical protein